MKQNTEIKIEQQLNKKKTLVFALIDSENINMKNIDKFTTTLVNCGVSAILVGGSTILDQLEIHQLVKSIKKNINIPIILFPGNVNGITPEADAIFFSSLLNSLSTYFIIEAQMLGAAAIHKYNLETIPMGYLIIGDGGTTGFIGSARTIPHNKPNIAVMYSLAAQYLGMRFLYLEAGSGVMSHVPIDIISHVKKVYNGKLIVGGGITTVQDAVKISNAGADIIVIGTLLEKPGFEKTLSDIVNNIS